MVGTLQNGKSSQLADGLFVTQVADGDGLTLTIALQNSADCLLHWGLCRRGGAWSRPPEGCWPQGTMAANGEAVRTPFVAQGDGKQTVTIHLDSSCPWRGLSFVVYAPKENRWIKRGGSDFVLPLLRGTARPRKMPWRPGRRRKTASGWLLRWTAAIGSPRPCARRRTKYTSAWSAMPRRRWPCTGAWPGNFSTSGSSHRKTAGPPARRRPTTRRLIRRSPPTMGCNIWSCDSLDPPRAAGRAGCASSFSSRRTAGSRAVAKTSTSPCSKTRSMRVWRRRNSPTWRNRSSAPRRAPAPGR